MEQEIELKLSARPEDLPKMLDLPALRPLILHPPVTARLTSIYYDTPDLGLRQRGMALRLRLAHGKWVQTLKTRGEESQSGLFTRGELETPSDGTSLDFSQVADRELKAFLEAETSSRRLKPRFITEFERVAQLLHCPDGTVIELALDHGEVRSGLATDEISEVELELRAGNVDRLSEVAALLGQSFSLRPESLSKAERGYRLLSQSPIT